MCKLHMGTSVSPYGAFILQLCADYNWMVPFFFKTEITGFLNTTEVEKKNIFNFWFIVFVLFLSEYEFLMIYPASKVIGIRAVLVHERSRQR